MTEGNRSTENMIDRSYQIQREIDTKCELKMRISIMVFVILLSITSIATDAHARTSPKAPQSTATGLFLCSSPAAANWLWGNWMSAISDGINVSYSSEEKSAKQLGCARANSDHLKPINVSAGALLITDGSKSGYAEPEYYVLYMRTHKVEAK